MSPISAGRDHKPALRPSAPAGPGPERGAAIAGTRLPPGGGSAGRRALPCGNAWGWIPRPGPLGSAREYGHGTIPAPSRAGTEPLPLTRRVGAALDTGNYW